MLLVGDQLLLAYFFSYHQDLGISANGGDLHSLAAAHGALMVTAIKLDNR